MELRELFSDLIRFETELWNAVDERLRVEVGLPLSRFEPLQVIDRLGPAGCTTSRASYRLLPAVSAS